HGARHGAARPALRGRGAWLIPSRNSYSDTRAQPPGKEREEMAVSIIGRPLGRVEGSDKVTGQARYSADVRLPGTLWGAVLRSPLPHASVVRVDAARARRLPGVRAVLTGQDLGGKRYGRSIADVPVLAHDRVRYVGDPVVAVAAEDRDTADEA